MRFPELLIVALASSCCVASAQVVVTQTTVPKSSTSTHSSSVGSAGGSATYHGSSTRSGTGTNTGTTGFHEYHHEYSNAPYSHWSGEHPHSLQTASLLGHSEGWHDNFGWHAESHEGFNPRENYFEHGANWHREGERSEGKSTEWTRREGEHSYGENHWGREEHGSQFHHEGWWMADRYAHNFEGRFAERGKEYFGNLARLAEKWTDTKGEKNGSVGSWHDGSAGRGNEWWGKQTAWRSYWDYFPTFSWMRERAAYFESRFWDWRWW